MALSVQQLAALRDRPEISIRVRFYLFETAVAKAKAAMPTDVDLALAKSVLQGKADIGIWCEAVLTQTDVATAADPLKVSDVVIGNAVSSVWTAFAVASSV